MIVLEAVIESYSTRVLFVFLLNKTHAELMTLISQTV